MSDPTKRITELIVKAAEKARRETRNEPEPALTQQHVQWPAQLEVGPGLEGAIACESEIGYVNGTKGCLIYRGYDIFDLCAYSTFEEVSYLLLHGSLPTPDELDTFSKKLVEYRNIPKTLRLLMGFPVEQMNTMAALRLGTNLMRQEFTYIDRAAARPKTATAISSDEDSIPMEVRPYGEERAIYEFKRRRLKQPVRKDLFSASGLEACYHLIAGAATLAAAIARLRRGQLPIAPDPKLSHAGNYLYMMTGRQPTPVEERVMDVSLILHADHGMNASTFATMVVASTLSDFYLSIGSGIAALNGPLHGGANEEVMKVLTEIGDVSNVKPWYKKARAQKRKIMGFGHRVYKALDPRGRVLGPLARHLASGNKEFRGLFKTADALEKEVVGELGKKKGVYPNVDFFSGIVYTLLGMPMEMFTPTFAVARVSGWTARVLEYLRHNRIFRPRAMYIGPMDLEYVSLNKRARKKSRQNKKK